MVHATEAFVARKSNPLARLFAAEGFSTVATTLPHLVQELDRLDLREKAMWLAPSSAIALMNSGTGPAAALSYPLGVHFESLTDWEARCFTAGCSAINIGKAFMVTRVCFARGE